MKSSAKFSRSVILSLMLVSIFTSSFAHELDFELFLPPGQSSHEGNSVALDSSGNIYLTGQLRGNRFVDGTLYADFAGTTFVVNAFTEYFLVKYNAAGEPLWAKVAGGKDSDHGNRVRIAPNGEPVVAVSFTGTNFHNVEIVNHGKHDFALARYTTSGELLWLVTGGGADRDGISDLVFDSQGDIYVVGKVNGVVPFGAQTIGALFQWTAFLAKYTGNGELVWVKAIGRPNGDLALAIDATNHLYLTGDSGGKFGNLTGEGLVLAKYDPSGQNLWTRIFSPDAGARSIVLKEDGFVIAGTHTADLVLGGTTLTSVNRQLRGFVASFTLNGEPQWAEPVGARAYEVALDSAGSVYTVGFYSSNAPNVAGQTPSLVGSNEGYLAKFSPDGQVQAVQNWSTPQADIVRAVHFGWDGNLYLTGEIDGATLNVSPWFGRAFLGRIKLQNTPSPVGPSLAPLRQGEHLILSWSAEEPGWQLEASPALDMPFEPILIEPVDGAPNTARIPISQAGRFFRLKK